MSNFKMSQYVYFSVSSEDLSFEDIEQRLGLKADVHGVHGEEGNKLDSSIPVTNYWRIDSHIENQPVDEQIDAIIHKLLPIRSTLEELSKLEHVSITLQVVRNFADARGSAEKLVRKNGLDKLAGQHQLLGWHLDKVIIEFLHSIKAVLDIDEYN
jgi:hypothetical protein